MTDHDQRACQRCGEPAGVYHFCPACRAQLTGIPTRDGAYGAAGSSRELLYEQTSNGDADRIDGDAATAVEVDPDPRLSDGPALDVSAAAGERAQLPSIAPERFSIVVPPPREVARLEQVLRIAPAQQDKPVEAELAAAVPCEAEDTPAPATPVAEVILEEPAAELAEATPAEEITVPTMAPELQARIPHYVAAHMLRAAFWFEQTSAFEARRDDEPMPIEEPPAASPEVQAAVQPQIDPSESVAPPAPAPEASESFAPVANQTNHWLAALCLLALIALVVALTGRAPKRRGAAD